MKPPEVEHFARQLAALTVTAARARTREQLSEVHDELAKTFEAAFTILAHDAEAKAESLVRDLHLLARRGGGVRA